MLLDFRRDLAAIASSWSRSLASAAWPLMNGVRTHFGHGAVSDSWPSGPVVTDRIRLHGERST